MPHDSSKVPTGTLTDFFYHGHTGGPLTDAEWDVQRARLREHGADPFDTRPAPVEVPD